MSKKRTLLSLQGVLGFNPNVSFFSKISPKEQLFTKRLKKYLGL